MEKILIVILEACDFKSCEVHDANAISSDDNINMDKNGDSNSVGSV